MAICSVVGPECESPAGWGTAGGIFINDSPSPTKKCYRCGQNVCAKDSALKSHEVYNRHGVQRRTVRLCDECIDEVKRSGA